MFTPVKGDIDLLKFALSEIVAGGEDHFNDHGYSLVGDNNQGFEVSLLEICEVSLARIAELERKAEVHAVAEEVQIALREKVQEERDALAAHVERLRSALNYSSEYLYGSHLNTIGHGSKAHMEMVSALEDTPATSLARRDALKQAEEVQHLIDDTLHWADGHVIANLHAELERLHQQAEGSQ